MNMSCQDINNIDPKNPVEERITLINSTTPIGIDHFSYWAARNFILLI